MPSQRTSTITLTPPVLGKVAKTAYAQTPRGALYDSRDFWPLDAKVSRDRLAVRPGFADFGTVGEDPNSLQGVNLIAPLNVAADKNQTATTSRRQLMVAAGGVLYKMTGTNGQFTSVGGTIDTGRNVQAASFLNRLYVANVTNQYQVYRFHDNATIAFPGAAGQLPGAGGPAADRCPIIATAFHRLVLSGSENNPHIVYFSRIDNADDWDFGITDPNDFGAALAVPNIGEPVTALIPHQSECLLAGTFNSLWVFRGDPGTGELERLEGVVGPINATAWCRDPAGIVYMLTRKGLYRMAGQCGSPPEPLSERAIPESLLALDGINYKAYLEYDARFRCVHIYVQGTTPQYFHYFPDTGGFWPVTAPGPSITAIGRYDLLDTTDVSGVLVGNSGNMVQLDRTAALGGSDKAYAQFLYPMAPLGFSAMVQRAAFVFGQNTTDTSATIALYGAETAEDVVTKPASQKSSITYAKLSANHNQWAPRIGGHFGFCEIAQVNTSDHISFEHAALYTRPAGRAR